ncbi:MAG: hypothetical protein JXJ30_06210 [Halothiobacillaceae bacterium]|nr:hypothetical protein [Halothiobacillaceae bacterium]
MTANVTHHHLSASADDADWRSALPGGWDVPPPPSQRRVGPANPWLATRVALVSPALRAALQCTTECLTGANGPLPAELKPRVILLTEADAQAAGHWLSDPVIAATTDTPVTVITTPEDDEAVTRRLQRLCGTLDEDWRHGVFMEVSGLGVLIRGQAGIGKSEVALELISRGHRLIADDAPCFVPHGSEVTGSCPARLFGLLEVRGIGILDIHELFGSNALKTRKYLRLIVDLYPSHSDRRIGADERLFGDRGTERIAGLPIPVWRLPVAPGRNIAVLLEAIVRQRNFERQRGERSVSPRVRRLFADPDQPGHPASTSGPDA